MCGIAGVLGGAATREVAARMAACLGHRGPDASGSWSRDGVAALAHTRLAIIDVSEAGAQPMTSRSGRYTLVFNGEIYNHAIIRRELDARGGHAWRGHSDTETLLAAVEQWGIRGAVTRTVGMFALAIWDDEAGAVTLGRDRLGEKPLYYGTHGGSTLFGSELKALRAHPAFVPRVDREALAAFMKFGYVPSPWSIYEGVRKLPPGTLLTLRPAQLPGDVIPEAYWSLEEVVRRGRAEPFTGTPDEAVDELERRLGEAVGLQQIADVPLGAFLSGGIDSSTIVALMQAQSTRPVHTFTIGFSEASYNEADHARAVAAHLGTEHTELLVTAADAQAVVPMLPNVYDEPFADVSQVPTYLVSRLARRHITVSLSGDAGDELFAGYNRYLWARRVLGVPGPLRAAGTALLRSRSPAQWDRAASLARRVLPRRLRLQMPGDQAHKLADLLAESTPQSVYSRLVAIWPPPGPVLGWPDPLVPDLWEVAGTAAPLELRMMAIDSLTYLPDDILCKVDRAAMAVSLETRVPMLDHRVVEFAWQLPLELKLRDGQGKWVLRQVLYRHVPRSLIDRPKMGFGVPIGTWLRGPLRAWAEELLSESRLAAEGWLDAACIRARWHEHLTGRHNWQYPLWNVLMFQAWLERHGAGA